MKVSTFYKSLILSFTGLMIVAIASSQLTMDTLWTNADVTLGSGTGQELGDFKSRNLGHNANMEMCNFDDNERLMSYFETWCKFDLSGVEASIPDGQEILYVQLMLRISNNTGQGYYAYHLKDIDDWEEGNGTSSKLSDAGGLTWDDAQLLDYENEDNYSLLRYVHIVPELFDEFGVTSAVEYELGAEGNKTLTLRFEPSIKEYDVVTSPKVWLGFWSRQAPWGTLHPELDIAVDAPHLVLYIGPPEPKDFSEISGFGNIDNYNVTPGKYGYWLVRDDEGDTRLKLEQRPPPINGTLGGIAIYDEETFTDFDISVKAKLNKEKDGGLDPKADFAIIFGQTGPLDYSYILFTGEDKNGFYLTDTTDGGSKTEVGDLNTSPAVVDMAWHDYRLVRTGTTVTAYIDGVEYTSVTDESLGADGKIGIGSYNDVAFFDDFKEGEGEPISVSEAFEQDFAVHPVPATGKLFINSDVHINKLIVTNINGQEIMNLTVTVDGHIEINTTSFNSGIYFISVYGQDGKIGTQKIVIQ